MHICLFGDDCGISFNVNFGNTCMCVLKMVLENSKHKQIYKTYTHVSFFCLKKVFFSRI